MKSSSYDDIEILRRYILSCPNLTQESHAISVALAALDNNNNNNNNNNTVYSSHTNKTYTNPLNIYTKQRKPYRRGGAISSILQIIRILLIDVPLAALFASYVLLILIHNIHDEYLQPQLELMEWNASRRSKELTYYHRFCTEKDLTTHNVDDLIIHPHFTTQDCVHHQMIHGMSIYPNILKDNTSNILREYILQRNAQLTSKDAIGVLSNQNRWSFGIDVQDHPIISIALKEISTHTSFRPALEKIVGPNPAIIEFTAITSAYGADNQIWHTDVLSSGSAARYAKGFIPSYSFFISLQDITAEMGATTICPGTYMCESHENSFCEDHCFQASGNSVWKKGYGILMNQQSFHRGSAHEDPNGPHRVLFIITFTHRPTTVRAESRQIGQGGSYSMKWDKWGHCLSDLTDSIQTMTPPWSYLRALGLYKPTTRDWGWDYISMISMRIANYDTGYTLKDLKAFANKNPLELPSFFLPPNTITDDMTWPEYLLYIFVSIKHFLFNLNCFILLIYFIIVLGLALAIAQAYMEMDSTIKVSVFLKYVGLFLFNPLRRILISHGSILFLFYLIWKKIQSSHWAKDIRNKDLYTSAFSKQQIPPFLISRPTMHVLREDVLVSTRSISQHYASYDDFMNYHPGNRALSDDLNMVIDILQYPSPMVYHFINTFSDTLLQEGKLFLIQNSNGDWVEMTSVDRNRYILREILLKSNKSWNKLDQEANYLLSQSFYSPIISRTMALHSREGIYAFLSLIPTDIGENLMTMNKFYNIQKQDDFHRNSRPQLSLPNKESIWRQRLTLKRPSTVRANRSAKSSPINRDASMASDTIRFKEGDIVDARYRGKGNEWYRGTITRIVGGGLFSVRYDDGDIDTRLPLSSVDTFRIYNINDTVQGSLSILSKQSWFSAKVLESNEERETSTLIFDDDGEIIELSFRNIRRLR